MKATLLILFIVTLNAKAMAQSDFKLPKTWDKDFVVTVSHTGSSSGHTSNIRVTYDSLIEKGYSPRSGPSEKKYVMKEGDRAALLAKFHTLKVDKIKPGSRVVAVRDGWNHSICFGLHCIEGGTSADLTEDDKNTFLDASRAVEDLAEKKAK